MLLARRVLCIAFFKPGFMATIPVKVTTNGTSARKRIEIHAAATESTTDGEGDDDNDDDDNDEVAESNDRSANGKRCEVAPPLLELEEAEKFRDGEGQIVEVETRGERKIGAIYFKADHIGKLVENAEGDMRRKAIHSGAFLKGHQEDYVVFQNSIENRARNMFLMYRGAIRAFASSRNPKARPFLEWAVKILQTAQLGSDTDRAALAAEVSRVDLKAALQVFRKCTPAPAGLYLIRVGTVADLRPAMGLLNNCNDDDLAVKWGRTKDFADRMATHLADFESIPGARPVFLKGINVDPFPASRAETLIAHFVAANGWKLESTGLETISDGRFQHRNRTEIAIVPKSGMRKLLDEYTKLQQDFAGGFAAILDKSQNLEKEAEHVEALYQAKLADERHQREAAERHCHTTLAYEREIAALKLAAAESRIKELERLLAARRPE
ncbi:hypothetical protein HDU87_000247 [Geranomyces variabilis]|uniref:Bro-N domain-containing protein n=1 Tax=Geranomyces variabilis TaxID=109894 RepID=A0AAD5XRL5_9FUNG|nr:hypothetical protein HDU87_000247 [Geranomyces variabilis]